MNGSWVYDYVTTVGPRTFNPNTQQTNIYVQDAAMAAAVDVINNSPDILPYTTVKIKRFSDCGSYAFTGYAPGYAMSVMATEIGEKHTDVIGVTGVESSITAKGTAEVFGNYQIPYCGAMSASPVLSDKEKYPYFFRVVASSGLGNHVSTLLKAWNVTRMAIVVQTDDLASSAFGTDVRKAMERQKIDVIDVINIKAPLTKDTVKFVLSRF
ncbi:periplasmic binding protein-like I [Rhizoclosmatium globosum]|uniref:Periplasmic binding protein-like I n=1 Tax=Rhizoclosmatium globosum TaxID=329046 RepID=A0A1Y2CAI0_9FUNG|nr:periplasmic binding protein-like I [Rhizoclosmatium globosum]|eukprot:ORY44030.1 periplasmic binding protein-like I [Rhizoclosmatium globosum]